MVMEWQSLLTMNAEICCLENGQAGVTPLVVDPNNDGGGKWSI